MGLSGNNLIKQTKRRDQITIFHRASALSGFPSISNGKRCLAVQLPIGICYIQHDVRSSDNKKRVAANVKKVTNTQPD